MPAAKGKLAAPPTGRLVLAVAPLFERSYAMFRSFVGTWMPFAAIFLASWAAGILMSAHSNIQNDDDAGHR